MPLRETVVGALLGLGTQMYSNAIRQLPYMRHPWEHVLGMGIGAVFANQVVKWEAKAQEDLDKLLAVTLEPKVLIDPLVRQLHDVICFGGRLTLKDMMKINAGQTLNKE